jgi:GT2 family glycosyltransferase/2-polyprenyl-3-methyl-5-hydroxy-6-metoxy-1,4-benzoquinol methylase
LNLGNAQENRLFVINSDKKYFATADDINPDDKNSSLSYIINAISENSVVLDVGCSYGYLGEWLIKNKNCQVYGIDIDKEAVAYVKERGYYKDVFNLDLDYPEKTKDEFDRFRNLTEIFDFVICADVLEHLKQPTEALEFIVSKLKLGGQVVVSIPNISHMDIILNLLEGKFNYSELGILDNTHLRFFTKKSFIEWIKSANELYKIKGFKFDVRYLGGTKYISEFLDNIKNEYSELYNIILNNNQDLEILQNIFALTKVNNFANTYGLEDLITSINYPDAFQIISGEIDSKKKEIEDLNLEIVTLKGKYDKEIKNREQIIENITKEKDAEIENLQFALSNKESYIKDIEDKYNDINNQLAHIYNSHGWKMLLRYYKIRDAILPEGSMRRRFFKVILKLPRLINKANIKKGLAYIKNYGFSDFFKKIVDALKKGEMVEIRNIEKGKYILSYNMPNTTSEIRDISFPKFNFPDVSIIIPVYNKWKYTYNCLKSIFDNTKNYSYEVIIVDDNSNDETHKLFKKIKNIIYIRNTQNKGFINNCNYASRFAKGKYIVFLNNDTIVSENWLDNFIDIMKNDKTAGIVGPKFVFPDGKLQEAGGIIWKDGSGWNYGRFDDPDKPEYNYVKYVDYISGACIMIKKDLWNEIGGFDIRYIPAYYEDTDLAFEVRRRGYNVIYQPKTVIVHFEGISNGIDLDSGIKKYQSINQKKFIEKWKQTLEKDHFENGTNVFYARDRSKNKKTILFIDHYVPMWDKDAGSKAVFSYLKLLTEVGFNVKFLGDNFFKHEPYTSRLQQMGIEVLYGEWYSNNFNGWIKENSDKINYIVLSRPHITIKYIDFLKNKTKAKLFYFGHDLHYLRELREYQILKEKKYLISSNKIKKIELNIMNKVDVSYYFSYYEIEELKKEFPDIRVKNIPLYIYDNIPDFKYNAEERENLLFVGGFAHRPNVDAILWFAKNIFPEVIKINKEIKLFVVGSNPPEDIKKLNSDNIIITGYVTEEELKEFYSKCRIVIAPLRYGAGLKGKIVEAMYYQVPIITSEIGVEGLLDIDKYITVCDLNITMAYKIIEMYNDFYKLNNLSKMYKEYINRFFSKEAALKIIMEDFK